MAGSSLVPTRTWLAAKTTLIVSSTFVASVFVELHQADAQNSQVIRTSHSKERTRELIDDYANSAGFDGEFERPRNPDRRNPSNHGQIDSKAIRQSVRAFADSMTQLTYALNEQVGQLPGLRQNYNEALRLSGTATAINKRAEKAGVDGTMIDDLQQLDADWLELAYRLEDLRGLSNDSRNLVADINDADQSIRQQIGIQPQLDRRQLNIKAAGLASDLKNLQDDIASELGNSSDTQAYKRSISRVRQIILNLITILRDDRADSTSIVDEYKQFEAIWTPLAGKLRSEDDRYIERGVRRVILSSNEIHQLLLLPQKVDQSQYIYLAKALKKDIDEFFERTPLILVMGLQKSKQALPIAEQFYAACTQFVEVVNQSQDLGEIADAFRKIEIAERGFQDVYQDVDSDRASAVLQRIVQTTNSLRTSLHLQQDELDTHVASDLAASIQNTTEQIAAISRRWLEQDNQPFADECLEQANELADSAAKLHDDLVGGRRPAEVKEGMADVYERWRRVYGYLVKCKTNDRAALIRVGSVLTPAIVDLRAIVLQ